MDTDERCPDCHVPGGDHAPDCHVLWAEDLRTVPASEIRDRNPFVKLLKDSEPVDPEST